MVTFIRNDVDSEIICESDNEQGDNLEPDHMSCIASVQERNNNATSDVIIESDNEQEDNLEPDDMSCIASVQETNDNGTSDVILDQPLQRTIIENIDEITVADRSVELMKDTSSCVSVEFKGRAAKDMDETDILFYKTIEKKSSVFTTDDNTLICSSAYVCNIMRIVIDEDKSINYLLQYDKSEPGVRREPFWKPYWSVTHMAGYGMKIENGRRTSQRTKQKTNRLIDECYYQSCYQMLKKYFEKMTLKRGDELGIPNKKLHTVGKFIYTNIHDKEKVENMNWMGCFYDTLDLEEIVNLISLYSLVNPTLKNYHQTRRDNGSDAITFQKKLYAIELKNFNIVYALIRVKMELFTINGNLKMTTRLPSFRTEICSFSIGQMCDNYLTCKGCKKGLEGKQVTIKETDYMGKGLFANEHICSNEYITPYEGKITDSKPIERSNYIVEIKYPEDSKNQHICYLDAKESNSLGRFANHSCVNNAVLSKMIVPNKEIPNLWIRAAKSISKNEEIFINYGDEKDRILSDKGGCKCTKCYVFEL